MRLERHGLPAALPGAGAVLLGFGSRANGTIGAGMLGTGLALFIVNLQFR
jgi:hypothetical protein